MNERLTPGTPFSEPLENAGYNEVLQRLPHLEDKIVRREYWKTNREDRKKEQQMWDVLRRQYNLHVPNIQMIVSHDERGNEVVFKIIDEIEGENLRAIHSVPSYEKEKADVFFAGLTRYLFETFKSGSEYLSDLCEMEQYVYGRNKDDKVNNFWIVDVNLFTEGPREGNNDYNYDEELLGSFKMLASDIVSMERKMTPTQHLSQARKHAREFLSYLTSHPSVDPELKEEFTRDISEILRQQTPRKS